MKIEQAPKGFQPVTIVVETEGEARMLKDAVGRLSPAEAREKYDIPFTDIGLDSVVHRLYSAMKEALAS